MTWTRLSDDFTDDTWELSDGAYRLHCDGLVWSNRKLLDLKIPRADLSRASRATESLYELLQGGWWLDNGDGTYQIQHHAVYQRTREQVIAQQAANQNNGRRGGRPRGPARERKTQSLSEPRSESPSERDGTGRAKNSPTEQPQRVSTTADTQRAIAFCQPCILLAEQGGGRCPAHRNAA